MKQGFKFIWKFTGLRNLISVAVFLNFFANMGIVLFLPLFQRTESLGPARYGIAMAFMTGGMLLGMLLTSAVKIPPIRRFGIFAVSILVSMACWAVFPLLDNFIIMVTLLVIAGLLNAIVNVFIQSTMQQTVPQEMRGKVFSLMSALLQGLTPLAMALGGVLAEFFDIRYIIFSCFAITIILVIPFAFIKSFKRFINFDPEKQVLSDII
jgi:MFS family permease